MKKLVLATIFILSLLIQTDVQAQVPNGGFENWSTTIFHEPEDWQTGNRNSLRRMGVAPVTMVPGFAGSAVRLETIVIAGDTSDSYITNSTGDPLNGEGGVPFAEMPIGIKAKYRSNMVGSDSAIILVVFKNSGTIISLNVFKVGDTQNTFTNLSFNLTLLATPDTVIVAIASSDLINGTGIQDGSWIEIDNFVFTGATTTIPNYEFDAWDTLNYDLPTGWELNGDSISKSSDSYSGTFAIRMVTQDYGGGNINPAYITSGHMTQNGTTGGQPYTNMMDTLIGYYKYFTPGTDSASIFVSVSHLGIPVGGASKYLPAAATYTYFSIPVFAGSTPDSMRVDISSSQWPATIDGSTLYLDHLGLKSILVNVENMNAASANMISSYPNPAKDQLNIAFSTMPSADFDIVVYNLLGSAVLREHFQGNTDKVQLNISRLSPGTYYFKYSCKGEQLQSSFVKE